VNQTALKSLLRFKPRAHDPCLRPWMRVVWHML